MKLPPAIESRLVGEFPPEQHYRARITLLQYGREPFQKERKRVLNAILDLADGCITELECLLERALGDYRDILFWHDNPAEARLATKLLMLPCPSGTQYPSHGKRLVFFHRAGSPFSRNGGVFTTWDSEWASIVMNKKTIFFATIH